MTGGLIDLTGPPVVKKEKIDLGRIFAFQDDIISRTCFASGEEAFIILQKQVLKVNDTRLDRSYDSHASVLKISSVCQHWFFFNSYYNLRCH